MAKAAALVLAALLVGWAVVQVAARRRTAASPLPALLELRVAEEPNPQEPPLVTAPVDPEVLASHGRYREAIQAIVHRALLSAGWTAEGGDRSITAREVLARLAPTDPRRAALDGVLRAGEAVCFGTQPATEERYAASLRHFQSLASHRSSTSAQPVLAPRGLP